MILFGLARQRMYCDHEDYLPVFPRLSASPLSHRLNSKELPSPSAPSLPPPPPFLPPPCMAIVETNLAAQIRYGKENLEASPSKTQALPQKGCMQFNARCSSCIERQCGCARKLLQLLLLLHGISIVLTGKATVSKGHLEQNLLRHKHTPFQNCRHQHRKLQAHPPSLQTSPPVPSLQHSAFIQQE